MDLYKSGRQFISKMWSPPAIKYHGLENQGSTSYLNSVLQVLFMTKDFRKAVEGYTSDNPDSEHIDLQLESLFGDLKSYPAYTHKITKKLGINNVYEQQDAAEYFEKILAKTSDDASKIFQGQLTHKTTCSSCGTETDAARPFWHLPLALEDSYSRNYSVVNGIEKYFRENWMHCKKCDDKSDSTSKCVIKHHPEVLMLLLKRFEFDNRSMRYVKNNCTVDVPCTLQIPENRPYELYAMVEYSGDLRSGQYIAKIKSEDDGRWYSFNDSCVTELHPQPFQSDQVEKSSSAYLLFYRKKKVKMANMFIMLTDVHCSDLLPKLIYTFLPVPAAGTQVFREEFTPGGSPLSTWETQDQSPAEKREREEAEGTAEEGKDAAATAFINRDEETWFKDKARVKSIKPGLSPDISNVEYNEDDMRGNAGIRTFGDTSPEESVSNMRSPPAIKYHGLENQGSTCYLNSVLQVLFMTKDFREAVERLPSENTEHIDLQLQSLFGDLKSRTAKTNDITKKLGIQDVHVNQDAEYFEKILALTSPEASQLFHGLLTHKTICSACGMETSTDKGCWHLPLALVDSQNFNVEKGIEEYFRASHLNGENQMYCDECDDRSDATTKCVIKHHPEVLMLLLKRFEFDYRCITYVKINCTVDIPCTLEIPENQPYELYAMVEHSGDLRSGHYIATIKSEDDGRWYSFNDKNVTLLDSQPFQSDKVEKSSSAYLLFYRKEKVPASGTQDQSPAERREREREAEEAEGTAEEGKDAAATAFIDRDEGRGIKDKARVTSRKPGLSPDISNVESKEGQQKMWQANGADVEQQGDGLRTETDVDVDKKGKTDPSPLIDDRRVDGRKQYMSKDRQGFEARRRSRDRRQPREDRRDIDGAKEQKRGDDKHAQRTKPYLWEGGEDQDRRGLDGVRQQKTSVPHVPLEDVDEERPADAQRRERDVKTDKSGGDEQSEQSGTSLTKKLYRDTEHHGNEALGNIKHDNLEGQQKMQQANGPDVEQQGDGLRREQDVDVDKERNTDPSPLIDDRRVDGRKHYMSKDRQGFEARRRSRDRRQLREDRRDIEGAKEQKRGDDKHVQRTETSMTEDQDRRGLDGVRQQRTSVPYVTPEDVDEGRPAKEQERKPFPNRGDSSRKQLIVKTVGEETIKTSFGTQRSIETKIIGIKTREKPAQQERLSFIFSDMKLSEQQKPGTKRHIVNLPTSAIDSNAERKPKVSDTQEQAAENQHAMKEIGEEEIKSRGHHALKEKNRNGKKKKITKQIFKLWKHADQTSESD